MLKKATVRLLRFSAFISLALGIFSVFFILFIVLMLFISRQNLNLSRLFVVNIVLIIIAIAIFFFFFGIYEFLKHLISVEKELDYLADEIKIIEKEKK